MKKNELLSYTVDFLSLLYFKKEFLDSVNAVVLFGSVARGNFDKKSDVDIFIDVKNKDSIPKIQESVNQVLGEFELKAKDVWHIRNIKNPIKPLVGTLDDERWSELKKELESYGTVLYGNFRRGGEGLDSYSLFEYSLKDFKQKERVALQRELLGYKSKKERKVYEHKGLIDDVGGKKLENNNVMVPSKAALSLQKFFTKNKVTPKIREIWIREDHKL